MSLAVLSGDRDRLSGLTDNRRFTYYPPTIPSASSIEDKRGHGLDLAPRE